MAGKYNTEANNKIPHAPYNFVPFSPKVIERYSSREELPRHDEINPNLKTGEIHITLTADTPIYVSDGRDDFFRGANGKYQIPGSSIRGMVRENMQMLGFGLVTPEEDFQDYQIYFRDMASSKDSVGKPTNEYYKGTLAVTTEGAGTKSFSVPQNVHSGYLYCESGEFFIRPTKEKVAKVSRKNSGIADIKPARLYTVAYKPTDGVIKEIKILSNNTAKDGWKIGTLLSTGRPVGNKENHLYVFTEPDMEADVISISREDEISYREDWENRKNSLKAYYDVEFWNLPKEGEKKPVFYIQKDGHTYFGMSLFLRIGYPNSISAGIPDSHKQRNDRENQFLDYNRAVLGYTAQKKEKEAYRSRVSFGDFELNGNVKKYPPYKAILGEPKPSFYIGYLKEGKSYTEDKIQLRGYKQYWLKEVEEQKTIDKVNVATTLYPLDKNSVFKGVIRYKNLHEDELGLLLWTLLLEKDCYQSIGMGKPYGLGRVKLTIDDLKEFEPKNIYQLSGLCTGLTSNSQAILEYIQCYKDFASEILFKEQNAKKKKKKIEEEGVIQDFFYIHQIARLSKKELSYMELSEYKNPEQYLPTITEFREKYKEETVPEKPQIEGGLDFSVLNKKFGRGKKR